jgi:spermidine/putrescine-binding protein
MKTTLSLLGVGCAAIALLIAGCNKNTSSTASGAGGGADKVVNLYSWSNYFPPETLKQFTAQTGIKVNASTYSSNEELIAKLSANDAGYDIVIPSDYAVQVLIAQKKITPLDRAKLTNFKNLDPKLLGLVYDKENQYSFPIFWGTTGLGINKEVMKEPIDSWSVLFDEKNTGKISMLKDARECFAVALKTMGKSVNESDPAILKQAAEKLRAQAKLVKAYDSDSFDEKLRGGDAALVHGYNGQLAKVVAEKPEKFAYIVPKEGATRWVDNACIPTGAKNADNAHQFLNYLLDAKVAADMVNEVAYASANQAAKPMIKAEIVNDKNIYVPDEVLAHCELMQDLGQTAPMMEKMWEEIRAK